MISKTVHLSLSEEEVAKFDMLRNELGSTKELDTTERLNNNNQL